ncbi:HlyD family secretion protein [Aurantibacillus circumpalustris]|uniref:HlyD family secretion protein n=1 Tax=Aurantibacillus circumpalustris TaxID=3036359 RepID=UPI00295A9B30|nr:HlyD family efflux transporter periplasmic adaptor subunit [Aurantibacillus circumpalustris]
MNKLTLITVMAVVLMSCKNNKEEYDASGTFESIETIVSAEANGVIAKLSIEEGQVIEEGKIIGYIDSTQLFLKRKQLLAQIKALLSKRPDIQTQTAALEAQLKQAETEQKRVQNLVTANAATQKQLDDLTAQVSIIKKQIEGQQSVLGITSNGITEESEPLKIQIEQLDDQLSKCKIINPIKGTVLVKYVEVNEMTAAGKPLYKLADLSTIILRAYITGDQFGEVKIGQAVKVLVDKGKSDYKDYEGVVEWLSNKAEFTPKTIQTKDERANLVYAIKIKIKNDGLLKIGMYGEVKF